MTRKAFLLVGCVMSMGTHAGAFNGHRVSEGPLTAWLEEIKEIEQPAQPTEVVLRLQNTSHEALDASVEIGLADAWETVGPSSFSLSLPSEGTAEQSFQIVCPGRVFSALYPVHAWIDFTWQGRPRRAHPILVFKVASRSKDVASRTPPDLKAVPVQAGAPLSLCQIKERRVRWRYLDSQPRFNPIGWTGSDQTCKASVNVHVVSRGGVSRDSLALHPPWVPGPGTLRLEYTLDLPKIRPLLFTFHHAIRDHSEEEPPSDGVTFRVWVDGEAAFQRHTASKTWVSGEVDLSQFGGQRILLGLESHPGPDNDTTCDQSYWGDPTILAGEVNRTEGMDAVQIKKATTQARNSLKQGRPRDGVFLLEENSAFVVLPGLHGILDAALGFVFDDEELFFHGLSVDVEGMSSVPNSATVRREGSELVFSHEFLGADGKASLAVRVLVQRGSPRLKLRCDRRIVDAHLGPSTRKAKRIYAAHGWIWEDPAGWRLNAGGHSLSTSHVGFDFENGVSLVQASDVPPRFLDVNPGKNRYALHTRENATLTLVPSKKGAFDAAFQYRTICEKKPSASVSKMAGHFFLDIWGGSFEKVAEDIETCVAYGMKDVALVKHVWQRWGYDYRLPDIYPPNPRFGGLQGMLTLAETCKKHGIPFGIHDNYIDLYPDAEGFTYEHVYFTENGEPHRAWYNEGRDALSYKWRPDRILPFLKRNLSLIGPTLSPTAYFVDVFASQPCVDYHDIHGNFHSVLECQAKWGEAFATIRDTLGGAFTCSEAGHDHLVGWLDGADCQCLTLGQGRHRILAPSGDWERTPWIDAVLHDRFILYGVGYSVRYQGGRPRETHGIYSDDYRTSELLMGHSLMSDYPTFQLGTVRKYWHAQEFARSLAMAKMESVDFEEGDIHRQTVRWDNGAFIHVNRGEEDWTVEGHLLPKFGCWGRSGDIEVAIERIDGFIVESSSSETNLYADARTAKASQLLDVQPVDARIQKVGDDAFELLVDWEVLGAPKKDLSVYVHFDESQTSKEEIVFQGDHKPTHPSTRWRDRVTTGKGVTIRVPEEAEGRYAVRLGLWDPKEGIRYASKGPRDGTGRCMVGDLLVKRKKPGQVELSLEPPDLPQEEPVRRNPKGTQVDFGWVSTSGGLRLSRTDEGLLVTPLPEAGAFDIRINLDLLPQTWGKCLVQTVRARDKKGLLGEEIEVVVREDGVFWRHDGEIFSYLLETKP